MAKAVSTISVNVADSDLRYGGHVKFDFNLTNGDKAKFKAGGPDITIVAFQGEPPVRVWSTASGPDTVFPLPDTSKPDQWTGGPANCIGKLYGFNGDKQYEPTKGVVVVAEVPFSVTA